MSQTPINTPVEINTPVANEPVILEPVVEDNNIDLVNKLLAEKQSTSNKRKKKSSSHK